MTTKNYTYSMKVVDFIVDRIRENPNSPGLALSPDGKPAGRRGDMRSAQPRHREESRNVNTLQLALQSTKNHLTRSTRIG